MMPHPRSGSTMCITRRAGRASDSTPHSKETCLGVEHLEPWPRYSGGAFRLGKTKALSKSFRWYSSCSYPVTQVVQTSNKYFAKLVRQLSLTKLADWLTRIKRSNNGFPARTTCFRKLLGPACLAVKTRTVSRDCKSETRRPHC